MLIKRRGTRANNGFSHIRFKSPAVDWSNVQGEIIIKENDIEDFNTRSHHNYEIRISLRELGEMIEAVAASSADRENIAIGLSQHLRSIIKLERLIVEH